ncbi:hypothetical protein E2C01_021656 [Portunus trituberculatus]|uniref:Uncharacterized protein n=1 Tax=Portunus trituberculatus TaxID=210409 RepID=A0A5B7E4V5_PORTR|nr:hypothetical protein [Portunus trituberculatus]
MKKKLREVSRHFGSSMREQSDLGTFLVPSSERDSEAGFGVIIFLFRILSVCVWQAVTARLSCETPRETFSDITTSFNGEFTAPPELVLLDLVGSKLSFW